MTTTWTADGWAGDNISLLASGYPGEVPWTADGWVNAVVGSFADYSESNANASEHPSVYEVCQKSGFKAKPKELVQQWDGAWVRGDFLDKRHPQEFVRGVRERVLPPAPPELPDAFIEHSDFIALEDGRLLGSELRGAMKTEEPTNHLSAEDL